MTHNPSRFKNFTETADGKGFTLSDGSQFKYDDFGGWFEKKKKKNEKNVKTIYF